MSAAGPTPPRLTLAEQNTLLVLARTALREFIISAGQPKVDESSLSPALLEPRGCFVTLTHDGELRGCIGNTQPRDPLFRAVMDHACGAAFRDPRFDSIKAPEIAKLEIEISVLTEPQPLAFTSPEDLTGKLRPHVDGVILNVEGRTATFLPQVWGKIPDAGDFMDELARKARLPASAWHRLGVEVATYQVESFTGVPAGG